MKHISPLLSLQINSSFEHATKKQRTRTESQSQMSQSIAPLTFTQNNASKMLETDTAASVIQDPSDRQKLSSVQGSDAVISEGSD